MAIPSSMTPIDTCEPPYTISKLVSRTEEYKQQLAAIRARTIGDVDCPFRRAIIAMEGTLSDIKTTDLDTFTSQFASQIEKCRDQIHTLQRDFLIPNDFKNISRELTALEFNLGHLKIKAIGCIQA